MSDTTAFDDDNFMASLEDSEDDSESLGMSSLAQHVEDKFREASDDRRETEERLLDCYLNYRGIEHERTAFTSTEESKVFIKVTKTKVLAAYGIVHEIMFPNYGNTFPVMVKPTPIPEGVDEAIHLDPKAPPAPRDSGTEFKLGSLAERLAPVKDKLRKGPGVTPGSITFFPATEAAAFMDTKMQDQFQEGGAHGALKKALFDSVLYGTGIVKGPFATSREYPYWERDENGKYVYKPKTKDVPTFEHIPIWEFYPDPQADSIDDLEWCVVRRSLTRPQMRQLAKRPNFRKTAVETAIDHGPNSTEEWFQRELEDEEGDTDYNRYRVLEYWGMVDREQIEEDLSDIEIPEEYEDVDVLNVSIWVCNGQVLKFSLNPYRPQNLPFHVFTYEYNPNSFFGVGIAENMADTQRLMNGFMRMAIDNAAKSGNLIWEVSEDGLVPGQNVEDMYPGKVIRRQDGAMGQAIFAHKFNNTSQENMMMYDKARQLADESTGFPSFAHGQTGISGVGRTASGISMLMGAASTNIKTVIKSFDESLERLGAALFTYNMTFDFDERALGDVTVSARGTDALMSNEIRSQRLGMFVQQSANPIMAQFVKWPYVLREIAKTMELDPDKLLNSPEEATLQAMQISSMGGAGGQGGGVPAPQGPGAQQPTDTQGSGGGQIGMGIPQPPGSPGFTGNTGGGNEGG